MAMTDWTFLTVRAEDKPTAVHRRAKHRKRVVKGDPWPNRGLAPRAQPTLWGSTGLKRTVVLGCKARPLTTSDDTDSAFTHTRRS